MKFRRNKFSKPPSTSRSVKSLDEYEKIASDSEESDGILNNLSEETDESSEEEVLPIHSDANTSDEEDEESDMSEDLSDDENKISDSDLDQPKDDLPDPKAWGKKKKSFYHGDRLNDKKDYLNEEDEEAAKFEEDEAKSTQKRWASAIDDAELSLDLLSDDIAKKKEERRDLDDEKIVVNLSQMNQQEKMKLLKKESPKFLKFIEDYRRLMKFLQDDLNPVMERLTPVQLRKSPAGRFLKTYCQTILNYCTNVSFYIHLKSQRVDSESHPVYEWISRYQEMLQRIEPIYTTQIKPKVQLILNGSFDFGKITCNKNKKSSSANPADAKEPDRAGVTGNMSTNDANDLGSMNNGSDFDDDEENDGKRPITYQIAKNKGLTPRRKKELRNPRVKHRMKYRKAKIRRKGQIREVRKELSKYSGEISGIKATVVKSIKLKH